MLYGLSGTPIPQGLPYADPLSQAAGHENFSPPLLYAIGAIETILGESTGYIKNAASAVSGDGGHGIFQLTSSWPPNYADPYTNALYAIRVFLLPALHHWNEAGFSGDNLVRLVAATFNEGLGAAIARHDAGDVDAGTTDHYAARALACYHVLTAIPDATLTELIAAEEPLRT